MPEIFLHLLFSRWFSHIRPPPPEPVAQLPRPRLAVAASAPRG